MSLFFIAIPYFLAAGTIVLPGFTLIKEWEEYKNKRLRRWVLIVLIIVGALSFMSLFLDHKEKEDEKHQYQSDIKGLKGQVTAASDAQSRNTEQFLRSFKDMSDKVATLQTEITTEKLQKKLASVQEELQKTQRAMAPGPKAELVFTFAPYTLPMSIQGTFVPVLETTLPLDQDGSVHVKVGIVNPTQVDAIDVVGTVVIPDNCRYASEPTGLSKITGEKETDRNLAIPSLHAKGAAGDIELDIVPPPGFRGFSVAFKYRCNTCILPQELLGGVVHIAGR